MLHSEIRKAKFLFSKDNKWLGNKDKEDETWTSVMYNPSEITMNLKRENFVSKQGTGSESRITTMTTAQSVRSMSFELIFDLVEKYEKANQVKQKAYATLANEKKFTDDEVKSISVEKIHIFNTALCCYQQIYDAFKGNNPVVFKWGESMEPLTGKITDFSSTLTYFSEDGNPLRARVSLSITRETPNF